MPAQQQVERSRAPVPRLRRRDGEDLPPQLRLFEPPWDRALEHPWSARTETSAGDHQDAAPSGVSRLADKHREGAMRFGLGHSVQIEAVLDRVEATLQTFGTRPIDPGEAIKGRGPNRLRASRFGGWRPRSRVRCG